MRSPATLTPWTTTKVDTSMCAADKHDPALRTSLCATCELAHVCVADGRGRKNVDEADLPNIVNVVINIGNKKTE